MLHQERRRETADGMSYESGTFLAVAGRAQTIVSQSPLAGSYAQAEAATSTAEVH